MDFVAFQIFTFNIGGLNGLVFRSPPISKFINGFVIEAYLEVRILGVHTRRPTCVINSKIKKLNIAAAEETEVFFVPAFTPKNNHCPNTVDSFSRGFYRNGFR